MNEYDFSGRDEALRELLDPAAYKGYLQTMTHFHSYSVRNILLIYQQMPHATKLAAYGNWPKQKRNVKKRGKGIKILSPKAAKSTSVLVEKVDPITGSPLLDADGKKILEDRTTSGVEFEEVTVFDISQTNGKPINKLTDRPLEDEALRGAFLDALHEVFGRPVARDDISAVLADIVGEKLTDTGKDGSEFVRDSIAVVVCWRFGIDVAGATFDGIMEWNNEAIPLFAEHLDIIKSTASNLITAIENKFTQICGDRGLNPMVEYEPKIEPTTPAPDVAPALRVSPTSPSPATQAADQKEIPMQPIYNVIERVEKTAIGVDFTHYDVIPVMPVFFEPTTAAQNTQAEAPSGHHQSNVTAPPQKHHSRKYIPPDPQITIADRDKYGYSRSAELLPVTKERAKELYRRGMSIYALYPDNREALVFEYEEIEAHTGIFGVPHSEWSVSREYLALASGNPEAIKEAAFLYDSGNAFAVYQLKEAHGEDADAYHFQPYQELSKMGLRVERDNYSLVHTGALLPSENPEKIFMRFNMEKPEGFTGKSMGISDVLAIQEDSVIASHYVDKGKYTELISFIGVESQSARRRTEDEEIEIQAQTAKEPAQSAVSQQSALAHTPQPSQPQNLEENAGTADQQTPETTPPPAEVEDGRVLDDIPPPNDETAAETDAGLADLLDKLSKAQDFTDMEIFVMSKEESEKEGLLLVYELNRKINVDCAENINTLIKGSKIKGSKGEYRLTEAAKKVTALFGRKRVAWVLAMNVLHAKGGTFSNENAEWAELTLKSTNYPKEALAFSIKTNPALLDVFITRFREIESDPKPFYEERLKSAEKRVKSQASNKPPHG